MILRVPQYLADLRSLPRKGVYWGALYTAKSPVRFQMVVGFCMTLSRDVVQQFVSYKPLQRLVRLPYSKAREAEFLSLNMDHEDVMVGRALHEVKYPHLIFAKEKKCRFHNLRNGSHGHKVTQFSVVIHHVTEAEYSVLMARLRGFKTQTVKKYSQSRRSLTMFCSGKTGRYVKL
ncbi:putative UDP-Gal or UDP-GlcNAc-dependent glycosyltransferase [Trypanosoma grayi]|uniref:putative UDP-Gal or UDP-GlcNAc-dependent glycosyltransferase n=1 Tax=Trypanosoma grayi TaxID=71804 RepID=UPI0004F4058B|nr:putative UDP-Gal or UDP-GlcNAc-dependent glycosyltransferase [Trypanosoma grayi]KEG07025.1 putative UDP-Gal or UDP-GlcNAc-dependent glycosyltransferase [Trypanosoma grayi]